METLSDNIQSQPSIDTASELDAQLSQQGAPEPVNESFGNPVEPSEMVQAVNNALQAYLEKEKNELSGTLYRKLLTLVEQPLLEAALKHTRGNQLRAAKILGISRGNFRQKMKSYDL